LETDVGEVSVDIGARINDSETTDDETPSSPSGAGTAEDGSPSTTTPTTETTSTTDVPDESLIDNCLGNADLDFCQEPEEEEEVEEIEVTLDDVEHLAPRDSALHMEPNGWAIVDLPMNVFGEPGAHEVAGELFTLPVRVRFTPTGWGWDYGDGETRSSSTSGASWEALDQEEFTETATSHTYAIAGDYTLESTVSYSVEYQFAGMPWTPVAGTLTVPSGAEPIHVGTAKTVLVADDCDAEPDGPGC
jgi:hypothetical protein